MAIHSLLLCIAAASGVAVMLAGCHRKPAEPLILVTDPHYPPYAFMAGDQVLGADIALAREIANALGRPLAVRALRFDEVIPTLIDGTMELAIAALPFTSEETSSVAFSTPYGQTDLVLLRRTGDTSIVDRASLDGRRVGAIAGSTAEAFLRGSCLLNPVPCDSVAGALAALEGGELDAMLMERSLSALLLAERPALELLPASLQTESLAVAVPQGNDDLLATVNEVIARLADEGAYSRFRAEAEARFGELHAAALAARRAEAEIEEQAPLAAVMAELDQAQEGLK